MGQRGDPGLGTGHWEQQRIGSGLTRPAGCPALGDGQEEEEEEEQEVHHPPGPEQLPA